MCKLTPGIVGRERRRKPADHLPKDDPILRRASPATLTAVDRMTGATRITADSVTVHGIDTQ